MWLATRTSGALLEVGKYKFCGMRYYVSLTDFSILPCVLLMQVSNELSSRGFTALELYGALYKILRLRHLRLHN